MRRTSWASVAVVACVAGEALAEDAPTEPAAPGTPSAPADASGPCPPSALEEAVRSFTVSGEIEVISTWDPRHSRARDDLDLRGPDADADPISLQNVEVLVDRPLDEKHWWGARFRAMAGEIAHFVTIDPDADPGAAAEVHEAYLSCRVPGGPLGHTDVAAGKIRSPLGWEALENSENTVVTRNPIACFGTPSTLTGVRATLPWSEKVSTDLWITNGWDDRTISDDGRTGMVQAALGRFEDAFASRVQIGASYGSMTGPGARKGEKRRFFEVMWDGTLGGCWDFAFDAVIGDEPDRSWRGAALYARRKLTEDLSAAARVGCYRDDLFSPSGARVSDVSLVLALRASDAMTLSVEYRHDWSGDDVFHDTQGDPSGEQDTVTLSVLVKF